MLPLIGTKKIKTGSVNEAARIIKQDWDKTSHTFRLVISLSEVSFFTSAEDCFSAQQAV